ncbi:uncharacterized protein N0V89_007606 [Didymosphaeria variabile]|uniref:Uncharacterized protein n=1 Tax=Didymosphaeria variabile TaxID=1932322 RepID=A0A9W8XJP5_9PLEO|nr:uncharacterized protein N0V89_007606 [Didymosphaeria variabile]KAJ4352259.1 hypothetical protein N0V89_007606 [Didymosphaeria variabile]
MPFLRNLYRTIASPFGYLFDPGFMYLVATFFLSILIKPVCIAVGAALVHRHADSLRPLFDMINIESDGRTYVLKVGSFCFSLISMDNLEVLRSYCYEPLKDLTDTLGPLMDRRSGFFSRETGAYQTTFTSLGLHANFLPVVGNSIYHNASSMIWALEFLVKGAWDILHEVFPKGRDEIAAVFALLTWILLKYITTVMKLMRWSIFAVVVIRVMLLLIGAY